MAESRRTAHNYTGAFALETRQHTLLGIDLGEGPPRKPLIFGIAVFAVWIALLWVLLDGPSKFTATLFILPPALITWFGSQKAAGNPRRFRFTTWVLAAAFVLRGHLPIINLGRRRPSRAELTPWNQRREDFPWSRRPAWERPQNDDAPLTEVGRPVRLQMKARLLGNEHVAQTLQRRSKKGKNA
ncbi:hypothetical protein GCM10028787_33040 [Brachybacterium horti]